MFSVFIIICLYSFLNNPLIVCGIIQKNSLSIHRYCIVINQFDKDKSGKIVKVNAFPGHNLPIGCLGVFILWLGWYGFNGAACTSVEQLGSVFLTTTVAPAVATVVCMIFTWIKYGKPDVSM